MNVTKLFMLRSLNRFIQLFLGYQLGQKFPFLKKIYNFSYNFFKPSKVKVFDQWLILHPKDKILSHSFLFQNVYEEFETELFIQSTKEKSVVLDIGANIGYYTLLAAKKVGSLGHVYAFEPEQENFEILEKNIALNRHSNITTIQAAVSEQDGDLKLYLSSDNKGDHRTYKITGEHEERSFYEVKAIALDSFFRSSDICPAIIKMDIQGFEFLALAGMKNLINRLDRLILFTEFWPHGLRASGLDSPIKYYEELEKLGFKIFNINESTRRLSKVDQIDELLKALPGESFTNLLCVKGNCSQLEELLKAS